MRHEWCPHCRELTEFIDDGVLPYGDFHEAQIVHCSQCGLKAHGKLNRVSGTTLSELRNGTLVAQTQREAPVRKDAITLLVKGSASIPYTVCFWREGSNVSSSCTCPAGRFSAVCKHRLALLHGDVTRLVGGDLDPVHALHRLLVGSDVGEAYQRYYEHPTAENERMLKAALQD